MNFLKGCAIGLTIIGSIAGCASPRVRGVLLSSEKNVWIQDHEHSLEVTYCMANVEGNTADPVCYLPRWSHISPKELQTVSSHSEPVVPHEASSVAAEAPIASQKK